MYQGFIQNGREKKMIAILIFTILIVLVIQNTVPKMRIFLIKYTVSNITVLYMRLQLVYTAQ